MSRSIAARHSRRTSSSKGPAWSGLLPVDKPPGATSHDVVERVRRRLSAPGAGHLGTLDPMATGLLLVAIGSATRCIPVWRDTEKTYEAEVLFGVTTDSQDTSGAMIERRPVVFDEAAVRAATKSFTGTIEQIPPMVSALKVGGERLHRLARRGIEVERQPRRVTVSEWTWLSFDLPRARFRVRCSSGTYVRTLAHDLGQRLGSGAALAALRRTRIEPWGLERAVTWDALDALAPDRVFEHSGIPLEEALGSLPRVDLDREGALALGHGQRVPLAGDVRCPALASAAGPRSVAFFGPGGRVLGLGEVVAESASLCFAVPRVVLVTSAGTTPNGDSGDAAS